MQRVGRVCGSLRLAFPWGRQGVAMRESLFPVTKRFYCAGAEEDEEEENLPDGEEWVMYRQVKKTSKKRLEAKKKMARGWKNIIWQAWTHMYREEHVPPMIKALKKQSKYDNVVLTPKHGDRFLRVYRSRRIREHNHARSMKVFPYRRKRGNKA